MNVVLWICQGVLAVVFAGSGAVKATRSKERLIESGQTGVAPLPLPAIRLVAVAELLAAVGLVLPWLLDVARVLTPLAAVGLAIVMVGAAVIHGSRREPRAVVVNAVLLALCVVVAAGRFAVA
ncbi:MAG TPA: DoxX family protein [Pseudonocardiaceae bacterium]